MEGFSSKLSSQCPTCGSHVPFELSRQGSIPTQSEENQTSHSELLDSKRIQSGKKINMSRGDIGVPEIFSEEEEDQPCVIVPMKLKRTEHPTKSFASNLANNRWLNNKKLLLSRPRSYRPSIKSTSKIPSITQLQITQDAPKRTRSAKDELTPVKTTINLVERVRSSQSGSPIKIN